MTEQQSTEPRQPAEGGRDVIDEAIAEQAATEDASPVPPGPISTDPSSTGLVLGEATEVDPA